MWVFITLIIFGSDKYIIAGTKPYASEKECNQELKMYIEQSGYPLPVRCADVETLPAELRDQKETIWHGGE
jgi:hypothetical protein